MRKERIIELELIRAIAFIFILLQHTIGGYAISPDAPFNDALILRLIYSLSKSAIPIFIFVSAVSLFYNYSEEIDIWKFYKKRIVTIFLPYACCTFIYIFVFGYKVNNIIISLIDGNTVFHLWYIGTIMRIYLFFPLVLFLLGKLKNKSMKFNVWFLIVYTILSFILMTNKDAINNWGSQLLFNKPNFYLKEFMSISPIYYSLYFLLGYYFSTYLDISKKNILKFKIPIVVIFCFLAVINYITFIADKFNIYFDNYTNSFLRICFSIFSMLFLYLISLYLARTKNKTTNILKIISHYSYGGYLIHIVIINCIANIFYSFYKLKDNYIFPSVTFFILTLIFIAPICHILSKLPYSKYVFGVTRYKNSLNRL